MKNKSVLALGIFLDFALVACDTGNGTDSSEKDAPKSVKIENITGLTGSAGVWIFAELPQGNNSPTNVAIQSGQISGTTLSVDLVVPRDNTWNSTDGKPNNRWTGNGDYYIAIIPISNGSYQSNDARIFVNILSTTINSIPIIIPVKAGNNILFLFDILSDSWKET
jgi:hypothetical protein